MGSTHGEPICPAGRCGADGRGSPGRFFAANELKTMMAFLVLNYDVRFAEEGKRPANIRFGPADLPSHNAKVMFRKRQRGEVPQVPA